ncbi:MAG: acyltransferase domain-containing protein, partial [Anaerolineales bacterium]|nr:acyltransferase domain-containing protein [Anaerolineales bacterium]
MNEPIAVVGLGAILPEAPDVSTFWHNIRSARYSITEVPPERWDVNLYYDPDPRAPDKTYSKIGGWVRGFRFEPLKLGIPIPPKIQQDMDEAQQWAIVASYQALQDYGYPRRPLNPERVAVILGNAMAGEKHYRSTIRVYLPEYLEILASLPDFQKLPPDLQASLLEGMKHGVQTRFPSINEDTMPGELANIIAGRVANAFNFSGPNFVTDAACASALSALQTAIDGLRFRQFDAVLTGGVDRNMGPESFIKFSKIGALSPDGSRPYAEGANGFVMGEGAAIFLLKRLADAERDGDKIYAVIRGIGGSSDGKGKGITAPNPLGQQRAIERAWKDADVPPETVGLIEGHGTSTAVGDPVEVASLTAFFGPSGLKPGSVALGSVKSNIGHLKSAAGAAGLLKTVLALHHKELPPSVNFHKPNPRIDFAHSPFYVNTETRPWEIRPGQVRRAGVSAFGFGGTNFHVVLEEYRPGALSGERIFPVPQRIAEIQATVPASPAEAPAALEAELPLYHGLFFLSASTVHELRQRVDEAYRQVEAGVLPPSRPPAWEAVRLPERLVIDYEDRADLLKRLQQAREALENDNASLWQSLALQGIYRGRGQPGKVAFLFPGQGSQYVNMLRDLAQLEPIVGETFREADRVMTPLLGRPLTDYIFVEGDKATLEKAEAELRNTAITQPAILTANVALLRLLERYGFRPDMVIGHSLGEYAALVAAGVLSFSEALQVVSARGKEMSRVSLADTGCMAAVSAPIEQVEAILKTIPGYVVIANLNSPTQSVIGGETAAVEAAIQACLAAGYQATKIPVSHAFHTRIVAPASQPLRRVIERMNLQPPRIPIAANVTGGAYPTTREAILDLLAEQIAAPVQFIRGIRWLYEQGARVFVEVGPKRVLSALVTDILKDRSDILSLATNHPRKGDRLSFHEALCRLYAAGVTDEKAQPTTPQATKTDIALSLPMRPIGSDSNATTPVAEKASLASSAQTVAPRLLTSDGRLPLTGSVVISGAGVGLPGRGRHVFSDDNIQALLRGEMRIEPLPEETRYAMLKRRPIRLVKSEAGAIIQEITEFDQTIKLAGQRGLFDPEEEFGLPAERAETMDISTLLAIAAGIEALRDAGIPLVMAYKRTTAGTYLPDRWKLPEALADETGVIFASAFPGLDRMAEEAERFYETESRRRRIDELRRMLSLVPDSQSELKKAIESRVTELEAELENMDYHLDRRYVFRILPMGHSQFAEYIGARGPNTHVNAACASTTHALSIAEDWIRTGRARRVIIIAGDDIISGHLSSWIGTSLMASGAATVEGNLRQAVLPFDRRRNGMIIGMGAAALVVESEDAVRERGMRAIAELLASVTANSAFHGTRLEVEHVAQMMERLVQVAERRFGLSRSDIAAQTVFVSHETYTPARGGSASAEIHALRRVFGEQANQVIIANTKGYTGHAMGVGIEDVLAVKALEYGIVPPIAHLDDGFEPDPALGDLNLSRGGQYPVRYALRLGAGFGSQIALALFRRISGVGERVERQVYQRWLNDIAGYEQAELEIVKRTLRIRDQGAPIRQPAKSGWEYGQGPTAWATASETTTLQEASSPAGEVAPSAPAVVATATPTPVSYTH